MFVCLDIETTGLSAEDDHVIEVAIVRFDHEKILDEWSSLVRPTINIPEFTTRLTGIDDEMVKDAPRLSELEDIIKEKIGDAAIMGHFIFFDVNFLNHNNFDLKNTQLDSCQLAQILMENEASYSLEVLAEKFQIKQDSAHRALDDVKANIDLLWRLSSHIKALTAEEKDDLKRIMQKSEWPWAKFILEIIDQDGGELINSPRSEKAIDSEKHADLIKLTKDLKTPFLLEEASHTYLDLLEYAESLETNSVVTVSNPQLFPVNKNISLIKHPNKYLDEERLKQMLNKDSLDNIETMLGAKLSLWQNKTKTGDKSELRIIKEENNLWNEICCQEYGEDQSYFKKAKESAGEKKITLISHDHFLRDRARKNPQITLPENTIVGELDNFVSAIEYSWHIQLSESKFLTNLNAIKKDNPDSSEVLDHIAGKISILFGFLGMVIQKHGEEKDPRHLLIVEAFHRNTEQWNKVIKSSESIYAAISALGEDIKASGPRDELEGHIHYLNKILLTNGPALWITLSQDQKIIIHAFPEHTDQIFQERVWKTDSELHLFSHHGDTGDDFNFLKSQLAIPLDTNIHKNDDVYPLPLFTPEKPLSNPNENRNIPEVVNEISKMLPEIEGNAMLLVTSKNSAEQFFYKFPKLMEETGRKLLVQNMGGGMGKIYKMSQKTDGKNFFIGNEYFMKFLLSEGVKLNFLGMHRLPFSHPNSPMQKTRSKNFSDPYKEFSLPQTNINYRGIIHRFLGNEWENKKILVLDPRVSRLN